MRNLARLNNAANRLQAIHDFMQMCQVAARYGALDCVGSYPQGASWRKIDSIAETSIVRILALRPEARAELRMIYPGLEE